MKKAEGHDPIPTLPIGSGKCLCVVHNYKHLGAIAAASLRFSPEVVACVSASKAAESALARTVCAEAQFPFATPSNHCSHNTGIALVCGCHMAGGFPSAEKKKLAIRYYSPLRRVVAGAWSPSRPQRPLCWDEGVVLAGHPSFYVALSVASLRLLARLRRAPPALLARLQVAGARPKLDQLPPPPTADPYR